MPRKKPTPVAIIRARIAFGQKFAIGPGKIDLLRAVAASGSISGAARVISPSVTRSPKASRYRCGCAANRFI
ncbi:MAG: hypothetical protein ACTS6J_15555 [Burkholderiales bacterium]